MVETLVAVANDVDVVFEQHVGVALVKAIVLTYECRASLGSMLLNFQIDLSEEIDGVGLGVLVFRIARRFSLGKYQLEMEIVFVVVIRLSGSIESEHAEVVPFEIPEMRSELARLMDGLHRVAHGCILVS